MSVRRTDLMSLFAIGVGTAIGLTVTARMMSDGDVLHEHVQEVVVTPDATAAVQPEPAVRIRIRGTPPRSGGHPLIYIDGVRMMDDAVLESVEPDDIDRVEVLKGAAALSVYGEEAADGVIQIYLKEATTGSGGN